MKNTKWIWRVLAVLFTLVVLAAVGFTGFRIGVAQAANLTADNSAFLLGHGHGFDGGMMKGDFDGHSFDHGRSSGGRGDFGGGRSGFSLFSPLFLLIRLAVLGGLIWLGYTLVKRSGWKLMKTPAAPATTVEETPSVQEDEKKESA